MTDILKPKKSPNVPGQYLGYSLQTTRLLTKILEGKPGMKASIEVFEDVGTEDAVGNKVASQAKSVHDNNPVSDRSLDLWKTLSNWVDASKSGVLIPDKTYFEIYVSKPREGPIVKMFSKATTDEEAITALLNTKVLLWGEPPEYKHRAEVAKTIRPYIENVFSCDKDMIHKIIKNFTLVCGTGSPHEDLEKIMFGKAIAPEIVPDVIHWGLGWVKKQTDILLEKGIPAVVEYDIFQLELIKIVRIFDCRTILSSFAVKPSSQDVETDITTRTYVRQLEIIDSGFEDIVQAVNDFLRTRYDSIMWGKKGLVHETSLEKYENALKRAWQNYKKLIFLEQPQLNEKAQGQLLYTKCSLHKATIEGLEIPDHFTPGTFHALADEPKIGWHPNYQRELKSVKT